MNGWKGLYLAIMGPTMSIITVISVANVALGVALALVSSLLYSQSCPFAIAIGRSDVSPSLSESSTSSSQTPTTATSTLRNRFISAIGVVLWSMHCVVLVGITCLSAYIGISSCWWVDEGSEWKVLSYFQQLMVLHFQTSHPVYGVLTFVWLPLHCVSICISTFSISRQKK